MGYWLFHLLYDTCTLIRLLIFLPKKFKNLLLTCLANQYWRLKHRSKQCNCLEQPHQFVNSLLIYKKCSILHILTPKPPTLVFVKMSKYIQWSCKWTVTAHIYIITVHHINYFYIHFFSHLALFFSFLFSPYSHRYYLQC